LKRVCIATTLIHRGTYTKISVFRWRKCGCWLIFSL
jgi:hypothetical protein